MLSSLLNSGVTGCLHRLGELLIWPVIVLIVLSGSLFSQTALEDPSTQLQHCNVIDFRHLPAGPAKPDSGSIGSPELSCFRLRENPNDQQTGLGTWPGTTSPGGVALWSEASPRSGTGIVLLAQNQPGSSTERKPKPAPSPPATSGSPGHIFWVIPAFKVDYGKGFQPLTPKEKFREWARGSYDPLGLGAGAVEAATLEHSSTDGFCGYGGGFTGYGKCFGALELDANVSSFIGDYALTVLLHQDPRYFRLGKGSFPKRVGYAILHVFVTYNDSGHTVFFTSALSGTVAAAGISNLYYPSQDRGLSHTISRIGIDLGNTALYNAAAEFWPDIHGWFHPR